jgi:LDH2 family malate/lactate/ureidoglycolate dehydrogenase
MRNHFGIAVTAIVTLTALTMIQAQSNPKEAVTTMHAIGPFDVKVTPQEDAGDPLLNRMMLDKQYHGDLDGTGKGQMLTAGTEVKGSGAYVAIEKVTGTLKGHSGSFVLQHTGTMTQSAPHLTIVVVPDSGTGELKGLTGKMMINIAADGKHAYDFEYTLPGH